jgi:hypothetical protein
VVNNTKTIAERLQVGREYEEQMIARLRADGHKVERATSHQDMYDKVDIIFNGYAAQLKRRESGEDMLVEVARPLGTPGRDMQSKAAVFIEFRANGSYIIAKANMLQSIAAGLEESAMWYWKGNILGDESFTDKGGNTIVARRDQGGDRKAHAGQIKLIAFIKPDPFWCHHSKDFKQENR